MKTALVLSGGGSRGGYEIGVCKALKELDIRFDMVFGTSVGAITGAIIVQDDLKLAEDLWLELTTDKVFDVDGTALSYIREIISNGGAGNTGLLDMIEKYISEDKVRSSHILYGLVTMEVPEMRGRYMFEYDIPRGRLRDYIMASASCFPAVQVCEIDGQKYIDGGYYDNMPVTMALKKGAEKIIAVDLHAAGVLRQGQLDKARSVCKEFDFIRPGVDLGNFLTFEKENTARIIRLGYLDAMKFYGRYDGKKYTFEKGVFTEAELDAADGLASSCNMNPCKIYDRESFLADLLTAYPHRRSLARFI